MALGWHERRRGCPQTALHLWRPLGLSLRLDAVALLDPPVLSTGILGSFLAPGVVFSPGGFSVTTCQAVCLLGLLGHHRRPGVLPREDSGRGEVANGDLRSNWHPGRDLQAPWGATCSQHSEGEEEASGWTPGPLRVCAVVPGSTFFTRVRAHLWWALVFSVVFFHLIFIHPMLTSCSVCPYLYANSDLYPSADICKHTCTHAHTETRMQIICKHVHACAHRHADHMQTHLNACTHTHADHM